MSEIVIRARFMIPDRFYTRFVWVHDIIWASCFFFVLFSKQFPGYFKRNDHVPRGDLSNPLVKFGKVGHHKLNSC